MKLNSKNIKKMAHTNPDALIREIVYHREKYLEMMNGLLSAGLSDVFDRIKIDDPVFIDGVGMGVKSHSIMALQALRTEFGFGPKRIEKFEMKLTEIAKANMETERKLLENGGDNDDDEEEQSTDL